MSKQTHTDVPPSCLTFDRLPKKVQKALLDIFNRAVETAKISGLPEEEIFQLLEDVIDGRDAREAIEEMERTGEKPVPWEKVKKDLGL